MVLSREVLNKMSDLITAGFGLVAALAWNSAIQELFRRVFGEQTGTLYSQFIYAVIVTVIAVFATLWIAKAIKEEKEESKE